MSTTNVKDVAEQTTKADAEKHNPPEAGRGNAGTGPDAAPPELPPLRALPDAKAGRKPEVVAIDPTDTDDETDDASVAPEVGTDVWYRLRPYGEWVKAVVVDRIGDAVLEPPLEGDSVHLRIELSRKRHNSASNVGHRLDVPHGTEQGQWDYEKPKNADRAFAREQALERERENIRRSLAASQ